MPSPRRWKTCLLAACGLSDIGMLIDAYAEDEHLADYVNQPDVKGLLVQHCPFHKTVNIIEAVYL